MRAIVIFLVVIVGILQYQYWFGATGQVEVSALQQQIAQQMQ